MICTAREPIEVVLSGLRGIVAASIRATYNGLIMNEVGGSVPAIPCTLTHQK